MGRKSKSAKSCTKNLGSYSKKWAKVTIEEEDEVNDSVYELPVDPEPLLKSSGCSKKGLCLKMWMDLLP